MKITALISVISVLVSAAGCGVSQGGVEDAEVLTAGCEEMSKVECLSCGSFCTWTGVECQSR